MIFYGKNENHKIASHLEKAIIIDHIYVISTVLLRSLNEIVLPIVSDMAQSNT